MPGSPGAGSPEGLEGLLGVWLLLGGDCGSSVSFGAVGRSEGDGASPGVSSVLFCLLLCILRRVLRAVWVVGGGGIAFLAASGGVLLGPLKDFNDCLWQESICSPWQEKLAKAHNQHHGGRSAGQPRKQVPSLGGGSRWGTGRGRGGGLTPVLAGPERP